ncbi:MAG: tRNA (adenosine(37)-N6)-threonylcarbamoyltransferase complex ATPase subunit type 1 TsaE [Lachnospiraceae bacterium]|nr:tRNA (adenosine(37)-N6)-threonylcarbamoyltransferase complex ATPase subunit type 1 TsaE [Lachnospiraceae bacterium]
MIFESYSEEETYNIGNLIGKEAKPGQVFCLHGDLGVGKTVFTKGFAKGLGVDEVIFSPTFTIVSEYSTGEMPFYHFDVYRISEPEEMYEIGFEEYIYADGVCLIEWAELIKDILPENITDITIEKNLEKGFDYRKITIGKGEE